MLEQYGHPTRCETLLLSITLDHAGATKHADHIRLFSDEVELDDDGRVSIAYNLNVRYFGNVVARLEAIANMLGDSAVSHADITELNHAKSLIVEVVQQITRIQAGQR